MTKNFITPNLSFIKNVGLFCNTTSKIKVLGDFTYISLFNRVYKYLTKIKECVEIFGTTDHAITSLYVDDNYIITGHLKGILEITSNKSSQVLRLHRKRITFIEKIDDLIYTGSSDGTICIFNTVTEEVEYVDVDSAVISFCVDQSKTIYIATGNKAVKKFFKKEKAYTCENVVELSDFILDVAWKEKEAFVVTKKGLSFIMNKETFVSKPFNTFKKPKSISSVSDKLIVHCLHTIYGFKTKKGVFGFTNDFTVDCDKNLVFAMLTNNSGDIFGLTSNNNMFTFKNAEEFKKNKKSVLYHENTIIQTISDQNNMFYTLSSESLIQWTISRGEIQYTNKLKLENAKRMILDENGIIKVFGKKEKIVMSEIKLKSFEIVKTHAFDHDFMENMNDLYVLGKQKEIAVHIGLNNLQATYTFEDTITNILIASNGLILVSCLDAKVYNLRFENNEVKLKLTIYGHSLPVKHMNVTDDCKLLFTVGADKLIKVWGLDFGECRKTLQCDSGENILFLTNTDNTRDELLWCYQNNNFINCMSVFQKVSSVKHAVDGKTLLHKVYNMVFATCQTGLNCFKLDFDEFKEEEMVIDDKLIYQNVFITSLSNMDKFNALYEKLEECDLNRNFTNEKELLEECEKYKSDVVRLIGFLNDLNFVEVQQMLYVLEEKCVFLLFNAVFYAMDEEPVFCGKIYNEIKEIYTGTLKAYLLKEKLVVNLKMHLNSLLDNIYMNWAEMKLDVEGVYEKEDKFAK